MAVSFKNQIQNTTDLKTIIKSQLKYFKSIWIIHWPEQGRGWRPPGWRQSTIVRLVFSCHLTEASINFEQNFIKIALVISVISVIPCLMTF